VKCGVEMGVLGSMLSCRYLKSRTVDVGAIGTGEERGREEAVDGERPTFPGHGHGEADGGSRITIFRRVVHCVAIGVGPSPDSPANATGHDELSGRQWGLDPDGGKRLREDDEGA
jgi:hypothetical protein